MTPGIVHWLVLVPMGLLLLASVWTDVKGARIPNRFVFSGLALGILFNTALPEGLGFLSAIGGVAIGMAALLPMYLLRAMGAGDVKLMAMVGGFLGVEGVPGAVLCSFVAGGVLSIGYAWKIGVLRRTLQNIRFVLYSSVVKITNGSVPTLEDAPETAGKFPYAVAIAIGTFGYLMWKAGLV
jgi:prepilin peptidase CpaA